MSVSTGVERTVGHFAIEHQIAEGGMGVVYRATDILLNRPVALKVLKPEVTGNADILEEARILSSLNHPHICTVFEIAQSDGRTYLAMELVEGESLAERIGMRGLPVETLVPWGVAIADSLEYAHERGVLHGDLKPANVIVGVDGRLKLLDFGLACWFNRPPTAADSPLTPASTSRVRIAGTLHYTAPELLSGDPPTVRSEVWSLGVMLYEMCCGQLPFQGRTGFGLAASILRDTPLALPSRVPAALRSIISRCLSRDPRARYAHAAEVRSALEAVGASLEPKRPLRKRLLMWGAAAVILVVVIVGPEVIHYIFHLFERPTRVESVCVLPLSTSGGDEAPFIAEALTDGITNQLARNDKLRVLSRSTCSKFVPGKDDPAAFGRKVKVNAVMAGRFALTGDAVEVEVDLIDTRDSRQLLGGRYAGKLSDQIAIQYQIVRELTAKLLPAGALPEQPSHKTSPEAYGLYLQGRHYWNKRSVPALQHAAELFQQAIKIDPDYAAAWAGLADSYALQAALVSDFVPARDAMASAKHASTKAIFLDNTLAEAHASLAYPLHTFDRNWNDAEAEYQRAVQLNPSYAIAHHWYAHYLAQRGRLEDALAQSREAAALDPLSVSVNGGVARILYLSRRYEEAIEQADRSIPLDKEYPGPHIVKGMAYLQMGRYDEALKSYNDGLRITSALTGVDPDEAATTARFPLFSSLIGLTYARSGRPDKAFVELNRLLAASRSGNYVPAFCIAVLYIGLNDDANAFKWLARSAADRDEGMLYLKVEPAADPLRAKPQFANLLAELGLN